MLLSETKSPVCSLLECMYIEKFYSNHILTHSECQANACVLVDILCIQNTSTSIRPQPNVMDHNVCFGSVCIWLQTQCVHTVSVTLMHDYFADCISYSICLYTLFSCTFIGQYSIVVAFSADFFVAK